jgi:hypothetical protein
LNVVIGMLLSITVQTAGLIALSFGRLDRYNRAAPIVAGVMIALIAITAPILTSTDVLFYAFVSSIGLQSYSIVGIPAGSPYRFFLSHLPYALNVYGPLSALLVRSAICTIRVAYRSRSRSIRCCGFTLS